MDLEIDEELERLLNEYGDDCEYECKSVKNETPLNPVDKKTIELLHHQITNKLTLKNTADVAKLMNGMPGAQFFIPDTKRGLKKHTQKSLCEYVVFCQCNNLVKNGEICQKCNTVAEKNSKTNNFMVYFPLLPQIKSVLAKKFSEIIKHLRRKHFDGVISDVDDGIAFKRISVEHPDAEILSLTLNADGATIYRSSKGSLWLTQVYQNFLPPEMRFCSENILLVSMYFGVKKPNPFDLVSFLAKELSSADISIFDGSNIIKFVPAVVVASCDIPARSMLQNMKGATGKFGCAICYHPGEAVPNLKGKTTIRFTKENKQQQLRTHNETVNKASIINSNPKINEIDGVKGVSCMLLFDNFDIINNFAIDFMHGIALGVTKHMIEIWIGIKSIPDPKNNLKFKLRSVEERKMLNNRILALKPLMRFKRKPRPIFDVANFKATELLHFLLYYLRIAMFNLFPTKIVKHFELLSAATYILCKPSIDTTELNQACNMLVRFADEFESIYGKGGVTMNVHLLRHYRHMVQHCGPLYCNSLFGFEANIGQIKNLITGTTDPLQQIAEKYSFSKDFGTYDNDIQLKVSDHQLKGILYQPKLLQLSENYTAVLARNDIFFAT